MIDSVMLKWLFELVVRPSLQRAFNSRSDTRQFLNGIPSSYYGFLESIRTEHGQLKASGITLHKCVNREFFQALSFFANSQQCYEKFGNMFYMVYAKGLKQIFGAVESSVLLINENIGIVFPLFRQLMVSFPLDCFVDVAMTIAQKENEDGTLYSLFFSKRFLNKIISSLPLKQPKIDNSSNFHELCGFRSSVRKSAKRHNHLAYIQVYYNEKNVLAKNKAAQKLVKFKDIDSLSQNVSYIRNVNHMRDTLHALENPHFGTRVEIRVSAIAFQHLQNNNFQPFLKLLTSAEFYSVPTFAFISFKIIALDIYSFILKLLSERYLQFSEDVLNTAKVFCLLLEGLVSRLDDWSVSRKLLNDLDILERHSLTNYIFFDESNFDYGTLLFRFYPDSRTSSNRIIMGLSSTMTLNDICDLLMKSFSQTVWEYLTNKFSHILVENNTRDYPIVSVQSLETYNVPFYILARKRNAKQTLTDLFQLVPRITTGKGYQNWNNLPLTKLMNRIRSHLDEDSKALILSNLLRIFKEQKCIVPSFNQKQFWITKRNNIGNVCIHFSELSY